MRSFNMNVCPLDRYQLKPGLAEIVKNLQKRVSKCITEGIDSKEITFKTRN
jgi:hypothetical protein